MYKKEKEIQELIRKRISYSGYKYDIINEEGKNLGLKNEDVIFYFEKSLNIIESEFPTKLSIYEWNKDISNVLISQDLYDEIYAEFSSSNFIFTSLSSTYTFNISFWR